MVVNVGVVVGESVGLTVGTAVGASEGIRVGPAVGDADGTAVGTTVGLLVPQIRSLTGVAETISYQPFAPSQTVSIVQFLSDVSVGLET